MEGKFNKTQLLSSFIFKICLHFVLKDKKLKISTSQNYSLPMTPTNTSVRISPFSHKDFLSPLTLGPK